MNINQRTEMLKFSQDNKFRNVIIGILIILLFYVAYQSNKLANVKTDLLISEQNTKALTDSVRVSKNKVGDLEFSKNILIADKNNLKQLNKDLYDEYVKENGKVSELTKILARIRMKPNDTIYLPGELVNYADGSKGIKWEYEKYYDKDNYRLINGVTDFSIKFGSLSYEITPLKTKITKDDIGFNIIQGLRETKNGDVEMFVRSDYPEFSVSELNSVIISPKTHPVLNKFIPKERVKRFGLGVYTGYGVYIDNLNNTAGVGINFGVGASYSLIRF